MEGVSTDKAPAAGVVVPHFAIAAFGFLFLSLTVFLSAETFFGHFYQPRLLALTHIAALGWVTMIIIGALYQLIPVVFETALFSERLARVNLWLFVVGIVGMVISFWEGAFEGLLTWASVLTCFALILFSGNVLLSIKGAGKKNYSSKFITTSILWLLFTAALGLLLALNHRYVFLDVANFRFLKIHAHFGIAGWFLQLIMGVASVLIPMFLISHDLNEKRLKVAYGFVNSGLILLVGDWLLNGKGSLQPIFVGLIVLGIISFLTYLREAYKKKLRKLDIGMKLTTIAVVAIGIPVLLGVYHSVGALFGNPVPAGFTNLYGFTIFFAFITPLILGQTYKTLPFIVWLDRYQKHIGKKKTPMPADLYSNQVAEIHMWTYVAAILILGLGIVIKSSVVFQIGALSLMLTAMLYVGNVVKIITHKTSIAPLSPTKTDQTQDLKELLKSVIDPEVEVNVVDMGLIYKLDYDGDKKLDITMTLSTPNCPVGDSIVMNVMETILARHPDYEVDVHLVFDPPWSPELISEDGRRMLGEGHKWKKG